MQKSLYLIVWLLPMHLLLGQNSNHELKYDLDMDGEVETLLFYDDFQAEFEETEFTKFALIDDSDTLWVSTESVWVVKPELYDSHAEINLDNRIGIIKSGENRYLWLTGFEFGCCYNNTTLLKYENGQVIEHFNQDFDVSSIETIDGSKYLIGRYASGQQYGDKSNYYFYQGYFPEEYRLIDDGFQVNKRLTQQRNIEAWPYRVIEPLDVYDARIIILSDTKEKILVAEDFASLLENRLYGITSLKKLDQNYFAGQSKGLLRRIRNELFASRGYQFNSEDLQAYFESQSWYQPNNKSAEEVYNELSEIEKHNLELIKTLEKDF